jgi:K+-sensing histidine kinase KdpD
MRTEAKEAGVIIEELKRGNLKARMPVKKMDEVGKLMSEFNRMADEIDRLVQGIKDSEQSRMALLQELAHDLRTPVASLKNLLETMSLRAAEINVETREELLSLSVREVEYFERLVEDLLLLAQVTEPKYRVESKSIDLDELIEEELELVSARYSTQGNRKTVSKSLPLEGLKIRGDGHLLRRLVRNALENAFSFASTEVNLALTATSTQIEILVRDDGPGLSSESLAAFGHKRITRFMSGQHDGRLSVGLGSVIMRAITSAHSGSLAIQNRLDERGQKHGAEVKIILPVT